MAFDPLPQILSFLSWRRLKKNPEEKKNSPASADTIIAIRRTEQKEKNV